MFRIFSLTLFFTITLSAILLAGCSSARPEADQAVSQPTEPPFNTEEPEKYQAFIVQAMNGETDRFFVARDGDKWRVDSACGTPEQTATLHTDKDFVIAFSAKAFSEFESAHGFDERPNMVQEISHDMLNGREQAVYEKVGSEGDLTHYRYIDAKGKVNVVTFDEAKKFPVKKEIFVVVNGSRALEKTITLEGFTTEVDPENFEIPKDFKKVSAAEMKKILTGK